MTSSVRFEEVLTDEMAEEVYALYFEDFGQLNDESPCDQMWPKALFMSGMKDPSVIKAMLFDDETDEWLAIAIYTANWDYFPWMAQGLYRSRYPAEWEAGSLFYTVATLSRGKRMGYMMKVMRAMAEHVVVERKGRMAYDLCDKLRGFDWPDVIQQAGDSVVPMETEVLGTQTYYVIGAKD